MSSASSVADLEDGHIEDNSSTNAGPGSVSIPVRSAPREEPPPANSLCFCKRVCKWFWIVKPISFLMFVACVISIAVCSITKKDTLHEIAQFLFMVCADVVAIQAALYYAYKMWDLKDTMLKVLLLEMVLLAVLSYFIKLEKYHNLTPFVQGFLLAFVLGATAFMSLQSRKEENLSISNIAIKTLQALEASEEKIKLMEVEEGKLKEELAKGKLENEMDQEMEQQETSLENEHMYHHGGSNRVEMEQQETSLESEHMYHYGGSNRSEMGQQAENGYIVIYNANWEEEKISRENWKNMYHYGGSYWSGMEQPETSLPNNVWKSYGQKYERSGMEQPETSLPNNVWKSYGQKYESLRRRGGKED